MQQQQVDYEEDIFPPDDFKVLTPLEKAEADGWELDLFSTFLSRKHSLHRRIGKKQFVKTMKIQ